ncbi:MAG: pyruvate ferredoxin oxidoreductase [Coriobacteriia bacterium]|nr:pyruvate ferredoxin oxidoreductase [Coriobacteriia bacterium]
MSNNKAFSATGNQMVAEAIRQCDPDVMAAYPITPQTTIVENYAKFVAAGRVHTEFVTVESEHSALSACVGASSAGARVATATASQGLAYMWEVLPIAAGMRLPIVMANANRTLASPINIGCDHSDIMGVRDSGWIILFAETAQEAYDNTIVSFKVAEDRRVLLPVLTTLDGFITSHAMERCEMNDDQQVKDFVGDYEPLYPLLDTNNPVGHGMYANAPEFAKSRVNERAAMDRSLSVLEEHGKAWSKVTGRPFELVDTWGTEDADYVMVILGSAAGNFRHVARQLREEGVKVGIVRPRVYRPFPAEQIAQACKGAKAVAVMDRSDSMGAACGPLGADVLSAFYTHGLTVPAKNYVYGLGGCDVSNEMVRRVVADLEKVAEGSADRSLTYLDA